MGDPSFKSRTKEPKIASGGASRSAFGHEISFGFVMRVGAERKDGKYPVSLTYRSSGRTVRKILDRDSVEREARAAERVERATRDP